MRTARGVAARGDEPRGDTSALRVERGPNGKPLSVDCLTREGWRLEDGDLATFRRLVRRGWIVSHAGGPYRLTRDGRLAVRAQPDNRA